MYRIKINKWNYGSFSIKENIVLDLASGNFYKFQS